MSKSRTIRPKRKKSKSGFKIMPESWQAFIARRLHDTVASIFLFSGLFITIALFTYNSADPSFNAANSTSSNIKNWGGLPGSHMADILLQTIGYAALLIPATLILWGLRLYTRQSLRPFILRCGSLLFASLFASITLAQSPSGDWIAHPYMSGSIGSLIFEKLLNFKFEYNNIAIISLFSILTIPTFLFAAAFTKSEIGAALSALKNIFVFIAGFTIASILRFKDWIAHYNDPGYQPTPIMPEFSLGTLINDIKNQTAQFAESFQHAEEEKAVQAHINYRAEYTDPPAKTEKSNQPDSKLSFAQQRAVLPDTTPKSSIPVVKPKMNDAGGKAMNAQQRFALSETGEWELPAIDLLTKPPATNKQEQLDERALQRNAELLQNVLADYGIQGEIVSIHPGPVVTLYELEPAPGTKSAKVISLSDDIARSMAAISVRCAVVPGRNVIGIELPNKNRQTVHMYDSLRTHEANTNKSKTHLPLILGKDISGAPIVTDLAKMPHLLIAGTTGSGKSVAVNTMILSLIYNLSPEKCRFIMIDPKMLELSVYQDIPHLLSPVVTEPGKAVVALKWAVAEMEERYRAMSKLGVRNIEGYNARIREALKNGETIMNKVQTGFDVETGKPEFEEREMELTELPYIVIIVDEFADLMLVAGKDVENAIQRLAQMARAAGIHLLMATQRPSVDVITGVIKANFPTRISFQVTSKIDSRTILGEAGAEQLLGMGDMLYMAPGGRITRVHGPFCSDSDVEKVVNFLKSQGEPSYITDVTEGGDYGDSEVMNAMFGDGTDGGEKVDELYDEAVAIIAREGKASTSFIQRHLQIGYNRAARIIEEMERQGVVSKANATGKREVLVSDHSNVA